MVFDSDCLIPPHYFEAVEAYLSAHPEVEVYGGPDAAHDSFTDLQKAISHAMTSPLTTGGIRGGKRNVGTYHPRSFNMGISRRAWELSGGYRISVKGEDIEFSMRLMDHGLRSDLIEEAYVYHKRRTDFAQFNRQVRFFGKARVNIRKFFQARKPFHWMPALSAVRAGHGAHDRMDAVGMGWGRRVHLAGPLAALCGVALGPLFRSLGQDGFGQGGSARAQGSTHPTVVLWLGVVDGIHRGGHFAPQGPHHGRGTFSAHSSSSNAVEWDT